MSWRCERRGGWATEVRGIATCAPAVPRKSERFWSASKIKKRAGTKENIGRFLEILRSSKITLDNFLSVPPLLSSELSFDQKYFHLFEYQTWAIYFWASITELWLVSTNFSFECKTRANLRTKKKLIEYNAYSCIANNAYKQQQTLVVLPKSGLLADHAINKFTDKYSENHFQWQQGWSIPMPDPFQK